MLSDFLFIYLRSKILDIEIHNYILKIKDFKNNIPAIGFDPMTSEL
jgi:hypothetical protein